MSFHTFSSYLSRTFHGAVGKLCLDGGFTCPNRDGTVGHGGCIFCGERGGGEHIESHLSVSEQVRRFFDRPHGRRKFIAYFQNFSGTYAPVEVLRARYAEALADERIVALAVATRPDCIRDDVCRLLSEIGRTHVVWVELGLQTASDETAERIHRGYPTSVFEEAADRLDAFGIPYVVHMMIGLPGESLSDVRKTAALVARRRPFGVKLHAVYVLEGTELAEEYRAGRYTPIDEDTYVDAVTDTLRRLPPETVIHRLTSDAPEDRVLAPLWTVGKADKGRVHARIRERMEAHGRRQGDLFQP